MVNLELLHEEIEEIKANVNKILLILENEGEVKDDVARQLQEAAHASKDEYVSHEDVKRTLQ